MNLLLNELGAAARHAGTSMLAQTAVLTLALLAVELIAGRRLRATLRCALWLLVVLKLLLPPTFTLPTSVAYWLGPWLVAPVKVAEPPSVQASVSLSDAELDESLLETLSHGPALQPNAPPPRLNLWGRLVLVWLAGAAAMVGLIIRRNLEVHRLVRSSRPATPDQQRALEDAAGRIGLKRLPQLRLTREEHSPAVCGLLSPVVVLPEALAEKLSASALQDVLLHELIHIHRRDLWLNLPQTLALALWWWNPFVWLANARVRSLREQAVDERVMLARDGDPETYPATLVEVARHCASRPTLALSFVGILESRRALRARVERLLAAPVPPRAHLGAAGWSAVVVAALLLLPMAFARRVEPPAPAPPVHNPRTLLIEVQSVEPRYRFGGEAVEPENLETKLREVLTHDPNAEFIVATDLAESSEELEPVIDAARAVGLRGLSITPPNGASTDGQVRSNIRGYIILDLPPPGSGPALPRRFGVLIPQSSAVSNAWKELDRLRYELKVPDAIVERGGPVQSIMTGETIRLLQNRTELEARLTMHKELLNKLSKESGDELRHNLKSSRPTSDKVVFQGFGQELTGVLTGLLEEPDNGIAVILDSIKSQIETDEAALAAIKTQLDRVMGDEAKVLADYGPYLRQKKYLDTLLKMRAPQLATNDPAVTPSRLMSPELAQRYGLLPTANNSASGAATNFYRMDPLLARRYGLIPKPNYAESTLTTNAPPPELQKPAYKNPETIYQDLLTRIEVLRRREQELLLQFVPSSSYVRKVSAEISQLEAERDRIVAKAPGVTNVLQTTYTMDPVLARRYGLLPTANNSASAAATNFYRMDPELARRYGLLPATNNLEAKSVTNFYKMDPALARRYGLLPNPTDPTSATNAPMSPELMRRYGLIPAANANPSARADPPTSPLPKTPELVRPEESARWGLGRQIIMTKLKGIVVPQFKPEGRTLADLVKYLEEQAQSLDPERKGLNFIINEPEAAPAIDASGRERTLSELTFRPIPPLTNVRLVDALDAMVRLANQPLRYEVQDYAVVFSSPPPETPQLYTRTYRVSANTFLNGLQAVTGTTLPPNAAGSDIQTLVRDFFRACGIEFPATGTPAGADPAANQRAVFFNDRTGVLFVRGTLADLDVIEKAVEALNVAPPQVQIEAKFVEVDQNTPLQIESDQFNFDTDSRTMTAVLTPRQFERIMKDLEGRSGTTILAAPKVTTLAGRQAQISVIQELPVVSPRTGETQTLPMGPVLDVIPEVFTDQKSVQLTLVAQLHQVVGGATQDSAAPQVSTSAFAATVPALDGHTVMMLADPEGPAPASEKSKPVWVFVTPIIIDPAGNRVNSPGK